MDTKIFLDSGNSTETREVFTKLGFLDGQTTNPSLVAKNSYIQELKKQGILDEIVIWEKYHDIALQIHEILPNGSISVEVYADQKTSFDIMLSQALDLANWFPGVYVKLPITTTGLQVAQQLVSRGICVNMTLCFSQDQAAAVHMATLGAKYGQVFISPFIGRLDDQGFHGTDLIKNIVRMYANWNSHVQVLGASIRNLDHLFSCFGAGADAVTIPISVINQWYDYGINNSSSKYLDHLEVNTLQPILFKDILQQDWIIYTIEHPLTTQGLEKFAEDWKNLFTQKNA